MNVFYVVYKEFQLGNMIHCSPLLKWVENISKYMLLLTNYYRTGKPNIPLQQTHNNHTAPETQLNPFTNELTHIFIGMLLDVIPSDKNMVHIQCFINQQSAESITTRSRVCPHITTPIWKTDKVQSVGWWGYVKCIVLATTCCLEHKVSYLSDPVVFRK